MVRRCCVIDCKAEWNPITNLSFFSFPIKNEEIANKWKEIIPHRGTLGKYSYICSAHFTESDFQYVGPRRQLIKTAVPSIFRTIIEIQLNLVDATDSITDEENEDEPEIITGILKENGANVDIITTNNQINEDDNVVEIQDSINEEKRLAAIWKEKCVQELIKKQKLEIENLRRTVKILQGRLRRRENKLKKLTSELKVLKRKDNNNEDLKHYLEQKFSGFLLEYFKNELGNISCSKNKRRYSKPIKEFATTLYVCSPQAYSYVRTKLNLPNEATIRKILAEKSKCAQVPVPVDVQ